MKSKFTHFFLHNSSYFGLLLIDFFMDSCDFFVPSENNFVTISEDLYLEVKKRYPTVNICVENKCEPNEIVGIVNKYGYDTDNIIIHSFPGRIDRLISIIDRELLPNIIWRSWGHDVDKVTFKILHTDSSRFRDIVLHLYSPIEYIYKLSLQRRSIHRIKDLYAVGIGSVVDEINVKSIYRYDKKFYMMPYPVKGADEAVETALQGKKKSPILNVMIGHSGQGQDNHIESIKKLGKFAHNNIKLFIMLPYGESVYVDKVKEYTLENWQGEYEFVEKSVSFDKYAEFMANMDVVIFDAAISTGLGNVMLAIDFACKIYVNRKGIIAKGLEAENIPFHYSDEIQNMSFNEFSRKEQYSLSGLVTMAGLNYKQSIEVWRDIYQDLGEKVNAI